MPVFGRRFRHLLRRRYQPQFLASTGQDDLDAFAPLAGARPLAFMHIPKTAGSALITGVATALKPYSTMDGSDYSLYGSFEDFHTLESDVRRNIHASAANFQTEADFISGHFAYSTLRQVYPRARFVTVLRDPRVRLLSHWLYWRQQTDSMLAPWGKWADFVRYSRTPLANFLNQPSLASQIDNIAIRMLLWPHPLIKPDRFIDPMHDERLVMEATARLTMFDFVDLVENRNLVPNLQIFLGMAFHVARVNETNHIPAELRAPLHREFSPHACELMRARSRLESLSPNLTHILSF
jgi:hypothetical protein